jgi:hypothetical protein
MRLDPVLAVVLVALTSGGWVCSQSDPCSDKLTCSSGVADVCCPPGEPYYCNGACSKTTCSDAILCRYPGEEDLPPCLLGAMTATIDTVTCGSKMPSPSGDIYTITATGTMAGCGVSALSVTASSVMFATSLVDCGSWHGNQTNECLPDSSTGPDSTTWMFQGTFEAPSGTLVGTTVAVDLAALDHPVLAAHTVGCE